jgi:hypothetical protein
MDRRFLDLKKFIDKRTRSLCSNHELIEKNISEAFMNGDEMQNVLKGKFEQVF